MVSVITYAYVNWLLILLSAPTNLGRDVYILRRGLQHDIIAQLLQSCWLHIHDETLQFHHISQVLD